MHCSTHFQYAFASLKTHRLIPLDLRMSLTEATRFDIMNAQRFEISRRSSCSPETVATSFIQDPLDPAYPHSLKAETSCSILMDAQRHFKHCSQTSRMPGNRSPESEVVLSHAIDPEAVIERLLLEAERQKCFNAQRYDPRSRTCSPEPSEHTFLGSNFINVVYRDDSDSSSSFASGSSLSSYTSDNSEVAESVSDAASSIQFADPKASQPEAPRLAASWRTGHTVTTRTVIHPVTRKPTSLKAPTPVFSPATSRPVSPKSSRAILRSLACVGDEAADGEGSDGHSTVQTSVSEPLTIFVTQQVETPLSAEEREREQLWREAMCSLHFGGDWEQMNKRFPPGQPRW